MKKDVKKIVKQLQQRGWALVPECKRHLKMRHPEFGTQIIPRSPSDSHWHKNLMKQIQHKEQPHVRAN